MSLWNQFITTVQELNNHIIIAEDSRCHYHNICYGTPQTPLFSVPHQVNFGMVVQLMRELQQRLHEMRDMLMRLLQTIDRFTHEMSYMSPQLDEKRNHLTAFHQVLESLLNCLHQQNNLLPEDLITFHQLATNPPPP